VTARPTSTAPPAAPATGAGPAPRASTGSTGTRVLGALILLGLGVLGWLGFVVSGPDTELGETVRLLYVHVPAAITTYLACFVCAIGSGLYLWRRSTWWDLVAESSAEIGTVFAVLTLVSGMLWGKPTWGVYWQWDARLTTTLMLLLLLLGYLALRKTAYDVDLAARRAAIVGLLLVPNVMIVNRSVEWWRTLHQKTTIVRLDPQIEGWQLFTWFFGLGLALAVFAWLLIHRFRVGWLERQVAESGLSEAIHERRAEAGLEAGPRGEAGLEAGPTAATGAPAPGGGPA
jgi:heme exporter protein C